MSSWVSRRPDLSQQMSFCFFWIRDYRGIFAFAQALRTAKEHRTGQVGPHLLKFRCHIQAVASGLPFKAHEHE
jgi:hypothetical protein